MGANSNWTKQQMVAEVILDQINSTRACFGSEGVENSFEIFP